MPASCMSSMSAALRLLVICAAAMPIVSMAASVSRSEMLVFFVVPSAYSASVSVPSAISME